MKTYLSQYLEKITTIGCWQLLADRECAEWLSLVGDLNARQE